MAVLRLEGLDGLAQHVPVLRLSTHQQRVGGFVGHDLYIAVQASRQAR